MKQAEFSEVLLPTVVAGRSAVMVSSSSSKWLAATAALFVFAFTVASISLVLRYEDKFTAQEIRISTLEGEVQKFLKTLEEAAENNELLLIQHYDDLHEIEDDDHDDLEQLRREYFGEIKRSENRTRNKRQIPVSFQPQFEDAVDKTSDGVPILDKTYASREGRTPRQFSQTFPTPDSEGLRLYESLVATGGRGEPKSPDFYPTSGSNTPQDGILPHHRTSAAWSERENNRRSGVQLKSGEGSSGSSGPRFSDDFTYTRSRNQNQHNPRGTSAGSSAVLATSGGGNTMMNRASRVPATGDFLTSHQPTLLQPRSGGRNYQYPPLQRIGHGDGEVVARVVDPNENENPHAEAEAFGETANAHSESRRYRGGRRQHLKRKPIGHRANPHQESSDEISFVKADAFVESPKTLAGHYIADVANYTTQHRNYEGNGRLRNADGIYSAWKPADWMANSEGTKSLYLSNQGVLTVRKAGLFYIYAQIHYLDDHDINGFVVEVNRDPLLQCTTMTETHHRGSKSNTCYTGGIAYLKENDRILVRDVEVNRYSIFKPEKSFFGLMRIGDAMR